MMKCRSSLLRRVAATPRAATTVFVVEIRPRTDADINGAMSLASYGQDSGDGNSNHVGIFRNVGSHADRTEFTVTLLHRGDGRPWTGRGSAEDMAEGETIEVQMLSDSPAPLARSNEVEFTAERR